MVTRDDIQAVLRTIPDPEMPVNIVDLGLIEAIALAPTEDPAESQATVTVVPTFIGCPALDLIRDEIVSRVGDLPGVASVRVKFVHEPGWSVERISDVGREQLRRFGVTVPARGSLRPSPDAAAPVVPLTISTGGANPATTEVVACPFCGATETTLESRFGPTRCKMIYYCNACRNSFEHLKNI